MSVTVEQFKQDMQKARAANAAVETALKEQARINNEIEQAEHERDLDIELKKISERNTLADKLKTEQDRILNQSPEEKLKIVKRIEQLQQLQLTNELITIAKKDLTGLVTEKINIESKQAKASQHLKELLAEQETLKNDLN